MYRASPSPISCERNSYLFDGLEQDCSISPPNEVEILQSCIKPSNWTIHVTKAKPYAYITWWRHQMETFSSLLAFWAGNSPVTGAFPAQRPVTRSLIFSLIWAWINDWVNNREAGDLRRHRGHYDVTIMNTRSPCSLAWFRMDGLAKPAWMYVAWLNNYIDINSST